MNDITIEREERYTLVTIETEKADDALFERLYGKVISEMETGRLNFVFDLGKIKDFNHSLYLKLNHINNIILKEGGLLVITHFHVMNEELFNGLDIVSTKTIGEASDYIFMEEIERHFLEIDDEEGENSEQ